MDENLKSLLREIEEQKALMVAVSTGGRPEGVGLWGLW